MTEEKPYEMNEREKGRERDAGARVALSGPPNCPATHQLYTGTKSCRVNVKKKPTPLPPLLPELEGSVFLCERERLSV